ncbi:zinc finger protein 723-like isoform X20 [Maniola hyperantus]|uniref:zinc finger protein 723-like isoform X20 n=1 Tax=Aphantopus hyperantus TaxID=2795564 RepID=UPI001569CC0C|nr:myoneurin-like isoform X14 [Maniola hyperantus]
MEGVLSDGMCRCCATEGSFKDFQVAYQWMGVEEIYGNMLKDCFDITLSVSEEISNGGICEVCITQLRNACNFKQQVQRTEEKFQKKLQEASFKTEGIKMEISRFEDDDSNISADDFSSPEYEVPIKVEKVEEKPKKRAAAKASTSKAKKTKASEGEPSVKRVPRKTTNKKSKKDKLERTTEMEATIPKVRQGEQLEKHRTNIREIIQWSNATPIRCRGGIGYACCFCSDQFPDPADLKKHTIEQHDDETKSTFMKGKDMYGYLVKVDITGLQCKLCGLKIETLEQIMDHLKDIHDRSISTDIPNHILPFKFDTETLRCFMCQNVFNRFKALQEHMHTHYRNYLCEVCDAGFVNRHLLLCHNEGHKIGVFACEQCAEVFDTLRKKKLHQRKIHDGLNKPHKCGYCDERFKENCHKIEHLAKVHGVVGPLIKCQACDRTFATQQTWLLHTKKYHLMQRQHKCTRCEMDFFSKRELTDHMVKHTGTREYRCEMCFKSYGRLKTLKEHIRRLHPEERRFKCVDCGQSFDKHLALKCHISAKHVDSVQNAR